MTPPGIVHYTEAKKYDMIMAPEQVQIFATVSPDGKKAKHQFKNSYQVHVSSAVKVWILSGQKATILEHEQGTVFEPRITKAVHTQHCCFKLTVTVCVPQYQFVID